MLIIFGIKMLKLILQTWDQAGERPYEVLQQEGLYDDLLRVLDSSPIVLDQHIFRGTKRHSELDVGDVLNYPYATSWSKSFDNALYFVEEEETPVILSLFSYNSINAIYNHYNSYGENEAIVQPITLRVTNKARIGKITILELTPN